MILGLQTADFTTHMRLWDSVEPHKEKARLEWESGRSLSDDILTKITQFLTSHDVELNDLTGIIIFSGPGSFTSLRIGHATANALADSLAIPVVGALGNDWQKSGLEALASAKLGVPAMPQYGSEAHITKPKS